LRGADSVFLFSLFERPEAMTSDNDKQPARPADCPAGHQTVWGRHDVPTCEECSLVATGYNGRTGEVSGWMTREAYEDACRDLQDQIDAAFDNQYFDGGW
jgi:hypothetical protein